MITQVQVRRSAFAETQVVSIEMPALADGVPIPALQLAQGPRAGRQNQS